MNDPGKSDLTIDTFGLLCPMPIIKSGEAMRKMADGQLLEVIATDPGAVSDLKQWCRANRHTYLGEQQQEKVYRIWIRKGTL